MSKKPPQWRLRDPDDAEANTNSNIARVLLDKLHHGRRLDASERDWLHALLWRYLKGKDLRADLREPVRGRSRPSTEWRDEHIARQYRYLRASHRELTPKDARRRAALNFPELSDDSIRKIVRVTKDLGWEFSPD